MAKGFKNKILGCFRMRAKKKRMNSLNGKNSQVAGIKGKSGFGLNAKKNARARDNT